MKNEEKPNSTAMPSNGSPGSPEAKATEDSKESVASLLPTFPRIVDVPERASIEFGQSTLTFRVSATETVELDAFCFSGGNTLKLKKIKPLLAALKKAGVKDEETGKALDAHWFNRQVKDPWHKVLRFYNRQAIANGTPVSVGFTRRVNKSTQESIITCKFGYEFEERPAVKSPEETKQLAEKAETKKSQRRASRQKRSRPGLVRLTADQAAKLETAKPKAGPIEAGIDAAIKQAGNELLAAVAAESPKK